MTYLNECSATIALVMQALILRGFWTHVTISDGRPTTLLARAIWIASAGATARLSYYDVWRSFGRWSGLIDAPDFSIKTQLMNTTFNCVLILAAYYALRALHASLPEEDRDQYSWLTAPFYPARCVLVFRQHRD